MTALRERDWPDETLVCTAIEREIESWARLRKSQGSKAPRCTPVSFIDFLYGHSTNRAAAGMRRLERQGLVKRMRFDCGGNAWALTRKGSALAQEAEPPCRDCLEPALPVAKPPRRTSRYRYEGGVWDTYDRCAGCLATLLEDMLQSAEKTAAYWRTTADEYQATADAIRERADNLRESVAVAA